MREGGREGEEWRGGGGGATVGCVWGEDMHACIHARTVIAQAFMVYGVSESGSHFLYIFPLVHTGWNGTKVGG